MRILAALERFERQLNADGRSPHTIGQYRRHVRLLARWAGKKQIEDLEPDDVARFLNSPDARHCPDGAEKKATSTNALRTSVRCFFSYLHKAGAIPADPARLVRRAICGAPPPRAIGPDEADRLIAAMKAAKGRAADRDAVLFSLLLATGLRLSSAISLDVENLDLAGGTMRVSTKRDRVQVVYLPTKACAELRRFVAGRCGPVFCGPGGHRLSTRSAQRRFAGWRERAGIPMAFSAHSLRHAFAAALYARTGDVLIVKEALGHAAIGSTLVYARVPDGRLREAMGA